MQGSVSAGEKPKVGKARRYLRPDEAHQLIAAAAKRGRHEQPVLCWAFPTTGASSAGFFLWAMQKLEVATRVKSFSLVPCASDSPDYNGSDVVLFATTDITQQNAR